MKLQPTWVIIAVGVFTLPTSPARAQQPPAAATPPAVQAPAPPAPSPAEVQAWFDAMVVVQAQRALGLSDAQYPQFVGRLKALQDARRRLQRSRAQLIQQIARMTNRNAPADEAQLREKLKALDDLRSEADAAILKAYQNLDAVLDLRQQARFRVFEEQIERRKFEILLNARRRGALGRGRTR